MGDLEIKNLIGKKLERMKSRLRTRTEQLDVLLDITNTLHHSESTGEVLDRFRSFVREHLAIEKFALYSYDTGWNLLLSNGIPEKELESVNVEKDLLPVKEISSVTSLGSSNLSAFDMVVPVYHENRALAYLLLGDAQEEQMAISSIIRHLQFIQLLTNIIVAAMENRRLAREKLQQETEKKRLIEKQKEMLEIRVAERTEELRDEQVKSDRLLNNILPEQVARELKNTGKTTPRRFESASVLFTDFVDFTKTASGISPQQLVSELNDIFRMFDGVVQKHGLEKIKTIGDAYMAAGGIPEESKDHAVNCVRAALEMQDKLHLRNIRRGSRWRMRSGIHSGPLVAGVVGSKKFTYDIWGDTVNLAARMESGSEAGKVNVSAATRELTAGHFDCRHRGKIAAKGKGAVDMYYVTVGTEPQPGQMGTLNLRDYVMDSLLQELPEHLYYHGAHHTLDVYAAAMELCRHEGVTGEALGLLKAAALMHDFGFTESYDNHEEASCRLSERLLPEFGYDAQQIGAITSIIMATRVPQKPSNHLEEILCDADLDYLGTDEFPFIAHTLFKELKARGKVTDENEWNRIQIGFLEQHTYFTETSKKLREPVKKKHIHYLKQSTATN